MAARGDDVGGGPCSPPPGQGEDGGTRRHWRQTLRYWRQSTCMLNLAGCQAERGIPSPLPAFGVGHETFHRLLCTHKAEAILRRPGPQLYPQLYPEART